MLGRGCTAEHAISASDGSVSIPTTRSLGGCLVPQKQPKSTRCWTKHVLETDGIKPCA